MKMKTTNISHRDIVRFSEWAKECVVCIANQLISCSSKSNDPMTVYAFVNVQYLQNASVARLMPMQHRISQCVAVVQCVSFVRIHTNVVFFVWCRPNFMSTNIYWLTDWHKNLAIPKITGDTFKWWAKMKTNAIAKTYAPNVRDRGENRPKTTIWCITTFRIVKYRTNVIWIWFIAH